MAESIDGTLWASMGNGRNRTVTPSKTNPAGLLGERSLKREPPSAVRWFTSSNTSCVDSALSESNPKNFSATPMSVDPARSSTRTRTAPPSRLR